jgi:RimJ/RimL family protein N-acetyltransferase
MPLNRFGQPVGLPIPEWTSPPFPPREALDGRYCRLELLESAHARDLWHANSLDAGGRNWTYLTHGPYDTGEAFTQWVSRASQERDPQFFAILVPASRVRLPSDRPSPGAVLGARGKSATGGDGPEPYAAVGVASLMRIDPPNGVIEVGGINYSPLLQRTPAATEAMFLLMRRVFTLGYRRYEWKCDSLNAPSRRAAQRLGFSYEGIFRQAIVTKGRNRDTAWYACIDREWPALEAAYERWLAPGNFDEEGRQRVSLAGLTAPVLVARG